MKIPFLELGASVLELRPGLDAAYRRVMERGVFLGGPELAAFERSFADFCGAQHCVGVASGLDALTLVLRAWGVGQGDEVIVPANTYIATWLAVSAVGAAPAPVEPDRESFNLDPKRVELAITDRTRAILAVHLYGRCAPMEELALLARERGLLLLEDAAQSVGATHAGRRCGALGHAAAFSFYPTKNLGAFADAGAVVTQDAQLAARVRELGHYGASRKNHHLRKGGNSRMEELQAAFLRVKLEHLEPWNERRRELAAVYRAKLAGHPRLVLPDEAPDGRSAWHLFVARVAERDALRRALAERGVETAVHYPVPPHLSPAYAEERSRFLALPVTEELAETVLSLPLHPHLGEDRVRVVCDAVAGALDSLP